MQQRAEIRNRTPKSEVNSASSPESPLPLQSFLLLLRLLHSCSSFSNLVLLFCSYNQTQRIDVFVGFVWSHESGGYKWKEMQQQKLIWEWVFIASGSLFFLGFLYAAVISKLLPPSDNPIVSAIQSDRYYCFLVPLTLPVLVVAVYFHWLSMKLFKHA